MLPITRRLLDASSVDHYGKVTFTYNPSSFFFHRLSKFDFFNQLYDEIYKGNPHSKLESADLPPRIASLCLAPNPGERHLLYRAQIRKLGKEKRSGQVKVHFLDIGNQDWIEMSELRVLKPEHQDVLPLVEECSIHMLHPNTSNNAWPIQDTEAFIRLIEKRNCRIDLVEVVRGKLSVELTAYTEKEDDFSVRQQLIATQHGSMASYKSLKRNPAFRPPAPKVSAFKSADKLFRPGNVCRVRLSHFLNPHELSVRPLSLCDQEEKRYKNLGEQMREFYSKMNRKIKTIDEPEVGAAYAFRNPKSDEYFRAECVDVPIGRMAEIYLVDVGSYRVTSPMNLFNLTENFLQIPRMALKVRMADLIPASAEHGWDTLGQGDIMREFEFCFGGRDLEMTIEGEGDDKILEVQLTDGGENIKNFFVERGIAHSSLT